MTSGLAVGHLTRFRHILRGSFSSSRDHTPVSGCFRCQGFRARLPATTERFDECDAVHHALTVELRNEALVRERGAFRIDNIKVTSPAL